MIMRIKDWNINMINCKLYHNLFKNSKNVNIIFNIKNLKKIIKEI